MSRRRRARGADGPRGPGRTGDTGDDRSAGNQGLRPISTSHHQPAPADDLPMAHHDVMVDCGWGRVIFGHTFRDFGDLAAVLRDESPGCRDIALYLPDPQVFVATAPDQLFIDPSYTYRLWLFGYHGAERPSGLSVRELADESDAAALNWIYTEHAMVTAPVDTVMANQADDRFTYLVATDDASGEVIGVVTGIDHVAAFDDPERGTSLWCLATSTETTVPGVGEALVRALAEVFCARGRAYVDLSVLHDNRAAIALYEKLGFQRVPVFAVKRKNPINEPLFSAPAPPEEQELNPYARIIADEARRRGIVVEVTDAAGGFLKLTHGARIIHTRESLSELTTAVAMSRCDDKAVTRRLLARAGLAVPWGRAVTDDADDETFLERAGEVVVKPARGEQGRGVTVGVGTVDGLRQAIEAARASCPEVLVEERVPGEDLRLVVIEHKVVAAAVRRPATVVGTGGDTIRELIERQSRRRSTATGGESTIPLDEATTDTVRAAGHSLDDLLDEGRSLAVRRTANLHTGGTIHDVTAELHPSLAEAAVAATGALDIPVAGLDLMVSSVRGDQYTIIEVNERPGLANHAPQPTTERFIDLLFPAARAVPRGWEPLEATEDAPRG